MADEKWASPKLLSHFGAFCNYILRDMSLTLADSLWETYYPRVFAYFYKRLNIREDVEDLTSLTMTSFMDGMLDESKQIAKPDAYLWRIAHNQLALFLRDKYKQKVVVAYDEN
jgi:DNA-directed RNA polymerase specialized sigma24 family protein